MFMATEKNISVGCLGYQSVCVGISLPVPKLLLLNAWRLLLGSTVPDRSLVSIVVTMALNADLELKNDSQPSVLSLRGGLGPPQVCFDFFSTISSGIVAVGELGEERICMKLSVLRGC